MSFPTSRRSERDADLDLALFALQAVLLGVSIVLVVHFRSTTATVFAVGSILVAATVAAVRLRGATPRRSRLRSAGERRGGPRPGDYRASSLDLFRVEKVQEDRALVEDCRTGVLLDVDVEDLDALRIVTVDGSEHPAEPGRASN